MPKFLDAVSRIILSKRVIESLKPEFRKAIEQEAKDSLSLDLASFKNIVKSSGTPLGYNIPMQSQSSSNLSQNSKPASVSFQQLREFSVYYWTARACIQKRQEQMASLEWAVAPLDDKDKSNASQKKAEEITKFFKNIGGPNRSYRHFLDMVLEDLLVLDAMAVYKVRNFKNDLAYLFPIDGSTIRLKVDASGLPVMPPDTAYIQYIRGQKVAEMTSDEMIYGMLNPRTSTPYGLSPLECLILVVQSALKSELSNLYILQEGNIPEGLMQTPETWTPDQIMKYQEYFDGLLTGNLAKQRRVKFIPGGKGASYIPTKKPSDMEFREFEEWLALKTCAVFGVSPQSIGLTFDINKATAEEQTMIVKNDSITPLKLFLKEKFDHIIQEDLGAPEMQFVFKEIDVRDEQKDATINQIYLQTGVKNINEVRQEIGRDPIDGGDDYFVNTPSGPVKLSDIVMQQEAEAEKKPEVTPTEEEPAEETEKTELHHLRLWQKKAVKDVRQGRAFRPFVSDTINALTKSQIEDALASAADEDQVRDIFKSAINDTHNRAMNAAEQLLEELDKMLKHGAKQDRKT